MIGRPLIEFLPDYMTEGEGMTQIPTLAQCEECRMQDTDYRAQYVCDRCNDCYCNVHRPIAFDACPCGGSLYVL